MELRHIPLDQLAISAANMRDGRSKPDLSDILPSVRARGVLVPILVRPNGAPDAFEIVAGRRRYYAALEVAQERGEADPLPCAIMEAGDDAFALEASLIENVARLDPDLMTQFETFARLIREGRGVAEISQTFGVTELTVERRLALGNLLPRIRAAFREERIDVPTVQSLAMATKRQQRDWLKLFDDNPDRAPTGRRLKRWLLGGEEIAVSAAIFPLEAYTGRIVADLFGEQRYFADPEQFWPLQNQAVAAMRERYLADGWAQVTIHGPDEGIYCAWTMVKLSRKKGGGVVIVVASSGDVEVHEGVISRTEYDRMQRAAQPAEESEPSAKSSVRPEIAAPMQNYLDLHRHSLVQGALLRRSDIALRVLTAMLVCGSANVRAKADPRRAMREDIASSAAANPAAQAVATERAGVAELLDIPFDLDAVAAGDGDAYAFCQTLHRLLTLTDEETIRILVYLATELLDCGGSAVEALGAILHIDVAKVWRPDTVFVDLLRGRDVINGVLAETAGEAVARANLAEKLGVQKRIIADCLTGEGREQVADYAPRYMAFPPSAYTEAGLGAYADRWTRVAHIFAGL